MDGGTAYAKELGTRKYRIKAPKGASVAWMGKVRGRTETGTFTSKGLVGGWSKLGHKSGATARTTLTWADTPSGDTTVAWATIGNPRINAKGELTFLAVTRTALPQAMPNFTINVEWAQTAAATRGWPFQPAAFPIDDATKPTATVQAYIPDNSSTSTTTFYSVSSSGVSTACANSSYTIAMEWEAVKKKINTAACGNGTIQNQTVVNGMGTASQVAANSALDYSIYGNVSVSFGYTPTGKGVFYFTKALAWWDEAGDNLA